MCFCLRLGHFNGLGAFFCNARNGLSGLPRGSSDVGRLYAAIFSSNIMKRPLLFDIARLYAIAAAACAASRPRAPYDSHRDRDASEDTWVATRIICWFASAPPIALTTYTRSQRPTIVA